jgi:2-hydroxy-3-keto-5-methylthiopentenyl-1-phosphate phosphatase
VTDGDYFAPAGDAFSVYPAPDGTAFESLRILVFHDGIQDITALKLCEKLCGREYVMNLLEEGIEPITFKEYPQSEEFLLNLREKINQSIKKAINS